MGSSSSKPVKAAASAAAGASRRQYPRRVPTTSTTTTSPRQQEQPRPGPSVHPAPQASSSRNEAIDLDARDPVFGASLRSLGPVHRPAPTLSHSSTANENLTPHPSSSTNAPVFPSASTNPALVVLQRRETLARQAEEEMDSFGKASHEGRQFLDVGTIKGVLALRDREGVGAGEIERRLRLKKGVVGRLGGRGVLGVVG